MKGKWFGLLAVGLISVGIIVYKSHVSEATQNSAPHPRVLLFADLRDANSEGDACAEIIHDVRAARARGWPSRS